MAYDEREESSDVEEPIEGMAEDEEEGEVPGGGGVVEEEGYE